MRKSLVAWGRCHVSLQQALILKCEANLPPFGILELWSMGGSGLVFLAVVMLAYKLISCAQDGSGVVKILCSCGWRFFRWAELQNNAALQINMLLLSIFLIALSAFLKLSSSCEWGLVHTHLLHNLWVFDFVDSLNGAMNPMFCLLVHIVLCSLSYAMLLPCYSLATNVEHAYVPQFQTCHIWKNFIFLGVQNDVSSTHQCLWQPSCAVLSVLRSYNPPFPEN